MALKENKNTNLQRYIHPIFVTAAAAAKSLQLCLTLCDPRDSTPPCSPVLGILQARILEWVAISFSNAWKWKVKVKSLSHVWLLATPWTAAHQASRSVGFSRQEYWSGLTLPSPVHYSIIYNNQDENNVVSINRRLDKEVFFIHTHIHTYIHIYTCTHKHNGIIFSH